MHFSWGFSRDSPRSCSSAAAVLSGCEGQEGAGLNDEGESPSHLPRLPRWEMECYSPLVWLEEDSRGFSHSSGLKDQYQALSFLCLLSLVW